jgi:predicted transcriptional regulator
LSTNGEKLPEMEDIVAEKALENEPFREIGENGGFQLEENEHFSTKKEHSKVKEASYRRVSAYTKSVVQYKRERERRRQVRVLAEKGFTQKQIADELGVSTRTVKRDWDKTRSYVKGQVNREIMQVADARRREFEQRYKGLTVNEELRLLKQDLRIAAKSVHRLLASHGRRESHPQTARQLDYILDLDNPTVDGFPSMIFPPQSRFPLAEGFEMKFYAIKNGEKRELFNIGISTKNTAPF